MNTVGYFEIQSNDCAQAAEFYSQVFGWKCSKQEGMPIEYWRIDTGEMNGAILKRPAPVPPPQTGTNAFVVSMHIENFDEIASKIIKSGGKVALPKFAVPGKCWQGYFLDLDGNTFGLFQVDEKAA